MAVKGRLLTDAQRERIRKFISNRVRSLRGVRRPACDRDYSESILWLCKSGARFRGRLNGYPTASIHSYNPALRPNDY